MSTNNIQNSYNHRFDFVSFEDVDIVGITTGVTGTTTSAICIDVGGGVCHIGVVNISDM